MELFVSTESLLRIFVVLLYAPVVLISYWKIIPRLSSTAKRIASGFLAAQVLVIALWVEGYESIAIFDRGIWHLEREWNIPSILAATQLALVGCIALITSWLTRPRFYLAGIGVVFLYIGLDDFFDWKLLAKGWLKEPYILIGAVIVVATIAAARRSSRRAWIWHLCLLTGLATSAMGGLVVDSFPDICGHLGFFRIDGCLQSRFLEEVLEFLGAWLVLVAMLGHFSNTAPAPRARIRLTLYAMLVLWIFLFLLNSPISRPEDRPLAQSLSGQHESGISAAQWNKEPINNGEFAVSSEQMTYIFLFLLYAPVGLISCWKIIPRLPPPSARLANILLAVQILVIVLSIGIRPASDFEEWLWDLDQEYNIPSILASTQLALVAGLAMMTAWLAKAQLTRQRLYLVGIGLVFLFLAWDEYSTFHEHIANWRGYYAALGAAVVTATLAVAARSPRRTWIWHLCLLTGLAMSAMGSILFEVDLNRQICDSWGFLPINGCLQTYNYEESLEFLGIWLVLVALLGHFSDARPFRVRRLLYALPALWVLLLVHGSFIPDLELRLLAQPASVQFESGVHLHGYHIDGEQASTIRLYVSAKRRDYIGKGYSIHLVDPASGDSAASRNKHADRQVGLLFAPGHAHVYRQQMTLEIPPQTPANRAFWIVLTLWREQDSEYVRQKILASDLQLLDDTQVVLDELVIPAASTATPPDVSLARFDNGFALAAVNLPERARPGEILDIRFNWHSDIDGQEDYTQFLHFGHQESGAWWIYDQQPLGPRLPTRLWYNGLIDSETWQVPLPADLVRGQYNVFTGLYRQSDLERMPARDADGMSFLDGRVPLGSLTIER